MLPVMTEVRARRRFHVVFVMGSRLLWKGGARMILHPLLECSEK